MKSEEIKNVILENSKIALQPILERRAAEAETVRIMDRRVGEYKIEIDKASQMIDELEVALDEYLTDEKNQAGIIKKIRAQKNTIQERELIIEKMKAQLAKAKAGEGVSEEVLTVLRPAVQKVKNEIIADLTIKLQEIENVAGVWEAAIASLIKEIPDARRLPLDIKFIQFLQEKPSWILIS